MIWPHWTRWQWLWRSRQRVLGVGWLGVLLCAAICYHAYTRHNAPMKGRMLAAIGAVQIGALSGYLILQGLFSGGAAFGNPEDDTSSHN